MYGAVRPKELCFATFLKELSHSEVTSFVLQSSSESLDSLYWAIRKNKGKASLLNLFSTLVLLLLTRSGNPGKDGTCHSLRETFNTDAI